MAGRTFGAISLYARQGGRKYLNAAERKRFLQASHSAPSRVALFCCVLFWGGSRISETLALTANGIDLDDCLAIFETLKRRKKGILRQVPLPADLVGQLNREFRLRALQRDSVLGNERLWPWSRTTAWRHVKRMMSLADVSKSAAMPKGLRHGFGVAAFRKAVPPHLVQRWLGHASLETTAIYCDVAGEEEREFAARIWRAAVIE
jgi:integrase/recombinase XerD